MPRVYTSCRFCVTLPFFCSKNCRSFPLKTLQLPYTKGSKLEYRFVWFLGKFMKCTCTLSSENVEEDSFSQESIKELAEQHDQASALLHACRRHLQLQSSAASPSHLAAMLNEAATTYEKLGDRKALQDCRNIMMQFTNACN